jgi:flagellar secretion chaperone FliS
MNGYAKYKKTSVESASKEKLLLMLYEACIKNMKKAIQAAESKDIKARGENIGKSYDIVMELMNTLNKEVGGDLAVDLERLYLYVNEQLTRANITGDKQHIINAQKVMETLYEGWVQAVEIVKKNKTA